MRVQVKYRSGRLDIFDTDSYTPAQPFGDGCMLADYEVRFDRLEKGLWLQAHFYDADPRFKEDLDDGVVPVGRRSMGWRFLLAEESELKEVEQVLVDGDRMLVRMGKGWWTSCAWTAHPRCCSPTEAARPWRANCRAWSRR